MITLYDRYERDFATNGFGILGITKGVVEEELNGIFKFTGTYPLGERLSDKVTVGATLRIDTPLGQEPFRIWSVNKTDGMIQIVAYHITFDLYYKIVEDKNLVNMNGQAALTSLLNGTGFTAISDVATTASARVVRKSVQEAIFGDDENSFLPRWGGEFLRTGFTLNAKNFRGRTFSQNPVAIRYGKNLVSYETEIDESTYYNRIMPVGFNALLLPEKYVDRVGIDLNDIRVKIVEYNNIKAIEDVANPREDELPLAQAEQALRYAVNADFAAGAFDPQVNHKIEFVDLSNTVEYENKAVLEKRYLGDEVRILNEDLLDVTARVIGYEYDPITNEYISMELGNFKDKPMSIVGRLELVVKTVDELSTRQLTEQYVTDLLTSALGGYVKELNGEMFITNNVVPELATKVWRWNINGLGYSGTGINGPYITAITMDGTILGSFIAAHTITANHLRSDVGQSLDLSSNSAITERVTTGQMESAINQTATTLTAKFGQIGGANLLVNSGFENGFSEWTKNTSSTGMQDGSIYTSPSGKNLLVTAPSSASEDSAGVYQSYKNFKVGQKYTLSAMIFAEEPMRFGAAGVRKYVAAGGGWKRIYITFTATSTAHNISIIFYANASSRAMYIDNLKLEEGEVVTDWSPHPSELTGATYSFDGDKFKIGGTSGDSVEHTNSLSKYTHSDGSYTQIGVNGMERFVSGTGQKYHYLVHAMTFIQGASGTARWLRLPDEFKGKQFSIYLAIADTISAESTRNAIQRIVATKDPANEIDYVNARVPVIAYKTVVDMVSPFTSLINTVQGMLLAIY